MKEFMNNLWYATAIRHPVSPTFIPAMLFALNTLPIIGELRQFNTNQEIDIQLSILMDKPVEP